MHSLFFPPIRLVCVYRILTRFIKVTEANQRLIEKWAKNQLNWNHQEDKNYTKKKGRFDGGLRNWEEKKISLLIPLQSNIGRELIIGCFLMKIGLFCTFTFVKYTQLILYKEVKALIQTCSLMLLKLFIIFYINWVLRKFESWHILCIISDISSLARML